MASSVIRLGFAEAAHVRHTRVSACGTETGRQTDTSVETNLENRRAKTKMRQHHAYIKQRNHQRTYHLRQNNYSFDALQTNCFGINIKL